MIGEIDNNSDVVVDDETHLDLFKSTNGETYQDVNISEGPTLEQR
jgi:hypothetical protein